MKCTSVESYRKFYGHFSVQIWARYSIIQYFYVSPFKIPEQGISNLKVLEMY